ncbi:MAG: hypothetical protein ACPG32_14745 [Akkermansiaceae bacterium]
MKAFKVLALLATAIGGIAVSSCGCCTGEERPPELRPLPTFRDVPGEVEYAK